MTLHATVAGWLLGPPSGANRRLEQLLRHVAPLLAADERITVLHRPDWTPPFALPRVAWAAVPIPAGPALARALAERRRLPRLLQDLGATVHDHGFLPLPRLPVPTVLLVHDLRGVAGFTGWPRWLARTVVRTAVARAAAVVVPSGTTAHDLAAAAPGTACRVIGNGVELPPALAPAPREQPGYVLHVGHVEARKNLGVVIQALALLPQHLRPELRLVGRDAGALRALRAFALRSSVRLDPRGVVADAELAAQFANARAVVLPSRCEGFGLPALEGLAHGRPVLVAAAGALPEVVGAAGVVLPADDPRAWAEAIAATGDVEPDAARQRRRARAADFGWERAAAALLALWREISARGQRSTVTSP